MYVVNFRNSDEYTGYIQRRIRILQDFCHLSQGEEDYRLTNYRDRTTTAPHTSPTDSGARLVR
jgi:hypothetical protein